MIRSENQQPNKEIDELERIRMLENRMRKPTKPVINEESLRSIKSTDSKKQRFYNTEQKIIIFEEDLEDSRGRENKEDGLKLELEVKNNRKITDFFQISKSSAKKQQKQKVFLTREELLVQKEIILHNKKEAVENRNEEQQANAKDDYLIEENRMLKEKLRLKDEYMLKFKNKMKAEMLEAIIRLHQLKRNEIRQRVSNNKIRLGEYMMLKKGNEFWVDGTEVREVKEKLEVIMREKQELEKSKKMQMKKSNKDVGEDPEEIKSSLAAQMNFLGRQEMHLKETLNRLDQEKSLHIKQYKLLIDEENSKYGQANPITGVVNWPKISNYQLLGLLGKGGFSEVYKGFDVEELREVACKFHTISPHWKTDVKNNFVKHALREQKVHQILNHPNIVKQYGAVEIDQNAFCTVLEFCQGPDLSYYLKKHKKLPEKEAKMIIKQVINAIKYLHDLPEKVIHYDLKPQNIIFHKGKIKITDFGLCKVLNQDIIELTSQGVGTYWYLPPECFVTDKQPLITSKVDIWSIGVIYFEMIYGQRPFGHQMSQVRLLNEGVMLKANQVNFPNAPKCSVSAESKDFIKACLRANVDERLDVKALMSHPLFQKKVQKQT